MLSRFSPSRFEALLEGALSNIGELGCLLVDLRCIEYTDVRGLHALLATRKKLLAQTESRLLAVVCGGKVEKLIGFSGLRETLFTCEDLKEAVSGCKVPDQV